MSRRKLAAGNWKMNGLAAQLAEIDALVSACPSPGCDVLICPPATLIAPMAARAAGSAVAVGGQDCHAKDSGAHTGDVSAAMLRDAGAAYVILGHSERRADHGESDADVQLSDFELHEHAGERLHSELESETQIEPEPPPSSVFMTVSSSYRAARVAPSEVLCDAAVSTSASAPNEVTASSSGVQRLRGSGDAPCAAPFCSGVPSSSSIFAVTYANWAGLAGEF